MKQYKAYLFDGDGTLYDTAEMIYLCFADTCRKFRNIEITREAVFKSIGMTFRPQLERLIGSFTEDEYEAMIASHIEFQNTIYHDHVKLFDNVKETLEELKKRGALLSVVTSRKIPSLVLYLEHTGIKAHFDDLVTPELTTHHKPHPEPALEAMKRLGVLPEETLFVGDALFDIECGRNAGCDTCYVEWSLAGNHPDDINADWYIKSMQELLA